jgi:hypothetical protein
MTAAKKQRVRRWQQGAALDAASLLCSTNDAKERGK